MRLGDLIATLEATPGDWLVQFSNGTTPGEFASWRGIYSQLTLCPGVAPRTVGDLLAAARAADGAEFTGYKGGEYAMHPSTPVWADDWGQVDYRAILGSHTGEAVLILDVFTIPDEYREMW